MAAKLTWEWGDQANNVIVVHKKKGKITYDELFQFFHEREQLIQFDGCIVVTAFQISSERDMHPFSYEMLGEPEGDSQEVILIQDDTVCPFCGKNRLYPQYCPECGAKVEVPIEKGA